MLSQRTGFSLKMKELSLRLFKLASKTVDILKEVEILQSNNATQNNDIPSKLIKDNADILRNFSISLNKCIEQAVFPSKLKLANITPVHKKNQKARRKLQTCPYLVKYFLKYMRSSCLNKQLNVLNLFYRSISVDSGRDSVPNIVYYQC